MNLVENGLPVLGFLEVVVPTPFSLVSFTCPLDCEAVPSSDEPFLSFERRSKQRPRANAKGLAQGHIWGQ